MRSRNLCLSVLSILLAVLAAAPVVAQCPCAGLANSMNQVDNAMRENLKNLPSMSGQPQQTEFAAALNDAATGNFANLDNFLQASILIPPHERKWVEMYRAAMEIKQKSQQGATDDQDLAKLGDAINGLPDIPGVPKPTTDLVKVALQGELTNANAQNTLCKILCILAQTGGPGAAGPGGFGPGGLGPGGLGPVVALPGGGGGNIAFVPDGYAGGPANLGGGNMNLGPPAYGPGEPVPDISAENSPDAPGAGEVLLLNLEENQQEVGYVIGTGTFQLKAGAEHRFGLPSSGTKVIRFDQGGGQTLEYTLRAFTYKFVLTENGWDLMQKLYNVTIDNTALSGDIPFVADNEQVMVKTGSTLQQKSTHPIKLLFDHGDGTTAEKILDTGTYQFRIDPEKNRLELHAMEQAGSPIQPPMPGTM
ncbi:MAG: hypothetical protein O3C40_01410 [Planctomycetota bacterium]|nr:hypothetical protein [Planctomycetota bacterium]